MIQSKYLIPLICTSLLYTSLATNTSNNQYTTVLREIKVTKQLTHIAKILVAKGEVDRERGSISYMIEDKKLGLSAIYVDEGDKGNFGSEDGLTFYKDNKSTHNNGFDTVFGKTLDEFGDKNEWKLDGNLETTLTLYNTIETWLEKIK